MPSDSPSSFTAEADYDESLLDHYLFVFDRWVASPFRILWDDYRGRTGLIILSFYILLGTIGTVLVPETSNGQGPIMLEPFADSRYPLGTDGLGQDLLALMVHATPAMFKMMIAGALFGNLLGVTLGMLAGYLGGNVDKTIMTITDSIGSIPGLPLILILAAIIEPTNPFLVGIIVNIQGWAGGARGIRSQVLPVRKNEYVEAAEALGEPTSNVLVKDILPNLLPLIFIGFMTGMTQVIVASVGLYFLGVLPFTTENWGVVLNYAYQESGAMYTMDAVHWLLVPTVTIVGLTFSLTMLAQAFDQVFNPRVRARHRSRELDNEEGKGPTDSSVEENTVQQTGMYK